MREGNRGHLCSSMLVWASLPTAGVPTAGARLQQDCTRPGARRWGRLTPVHSPFACGKAQGCLPCAARNLHLHAPWRHQQEGARTF